MPKTKPAAKAKSAKIATSAAPADETVAGSQAEYSKLLPAALALDAKAVVPCHADASLAYHNVTIGVASLLAQKTAAAALPGTNVTALAALPNQCLALAFAADQAMQAKGGSSADLAAALSQGSVLRKKLFAGADALVAAGLIPAKPVAALHAGKGKIDAANDLVGLAALFKANANAIKGKTAISAADVARASTLGTSLLTMLKPTRAKKTRDASAVQASDVRDRMWTLVQQGHASLWKACAYLYGPGEIDARVPALQARAATTSARKKANAAKKAAKTPATPKPATT